MNKTTYLRRVLDTVRAFPETTTVAPVSLANFLSLREAMRAAHKGKLRLAACLVASATGYPLKAFTQSPAYLALPKIRAHD